jgi:hypothetical protein
MLAFSCLYTTNEATYLVPGDPLTRGGAFQKEFECILATEISGPSLCTAQALGLMCGYEGIFGSLLKTMNYLDRYGVVYKQLHLGERLHVHMQSQLTPGSRSMRVAHAISWIDWGFYIFEWKSMVSLHRCKTIKKPTSPKLWEDASSFLSREESPDCWWFAYPVSVLPQMSYKREIFIAECALTEIIDDVLTFLTTLDSVTHSRGSSNSDRGVGLYMRLTNWKYSLPDCLQAGGSELPTALLLHANFDFVNINLLRPFEGLPKEEFGGVDPKATGLAHASNLVATLWAFRALYSIRNEFWLCQLLSVAAFRVLHDLESGPIHTDTFIKACQGLYELGERFALATDVLSSIQAVLKRDNIVLPSFATKQLEKGLKPSMPSVMRETYVPIGVKGGSNDAGSAVLTYGLLKISDILAPIEVEISPE